MIGKKILILSLFGASIALASEPLRWIGIRQGSDWSVRVWDDGSAMMLYGSSDAIQAPPASFDLEKVAAAPEPLVSTDLGPEKGVKVNSSLMVGREGNKACYTASIEYAKRLVKEVFEKSWISAGEVERFQMWLEKEPPLGVQGTSKNPIF